jgi:predicted nucleic acid-binding protein
VVRPDSAPSDAADHLARRVGSVRRLRSILTLVPPTAHIYRTALARCTARRLASGIVFDALHLVTAEEAGADAMVTFNQADFARLTDTGSPRIVVPPDPPTVTL